MKIEGLLPFSQGLVWGCM